MLMTVRSWIAALLIVLAARLLGGRLHLSSPAKPTPEDLCARAAAWANLGMGVIEEGGAD